MSNKPSEYFANAIVRAGSVAIDCELCGRTHFATSREYYYDEGELEELRAKAKEEPDKYLEWADRDSIGWGHINGQQAVIDCPCNKLKDCEDWIWSHRYLIKDYLLARTEAEAKAANTDKEAFKKLVFKDTK